MHFIAIRIWRSAESFFVVRTIGPAIGCTILPEGGGLRPTLDYSLCEWCNLSENKRWSRLPSGGVGISHTYSEYKDWIKGAKPFATVRAELESLSKYRANFRELVQPSSITAVGRFSEFLRIFDLSTVYPLVLGIMGADAHHDELAGMLEDLESYIFRRAVCDLGTKNYNRFFLTVLNKLANSQFDRTNLRAALVEQKGDSVVWPDNAQFKQAWLTQPVYRSMGAGRVQYALREIERRLHQPRSERIEILSELSVEHVLPEEWIEQWLLPNDNRGVTLFEMFDKSREADDVEATEKRDRAKHTFGNLTLLTQPLNSSVSNSAFEIKKPEIVKNSALALNRYFHDKEDWDETQIIARGDALFVHTLGKWPYPHSAG